MSLSLNKLYNELKENKINDVEMRIRGEDIHYVFDQNQSDFANTHAPDSSNKLIIGKTF